MTIPFTITKSDTRYLKQNVSVGDEKIMSLKSKTVSSDSSDMSVRFESAVIPFAYLNEKAFDISSRRILSKHLRKYALAWINLAKR